MLWGEWPRTVLLAANLIWTTLCLGGYRPETMGVTCSLTAATLSLVCAARAFTGRERGERWGSVIWLLPFLGYAALNVLLISPVPWLGWLDWLGWANLIAVFGVAGGIRGAAPRRVLFSTLIALGIGAVALACHQRFVRSDWLMLGRIQVDQFLGRASGPFGIPNSLAAFLLLLLPVSGALAGRRQSSAAGRVGWGWVTLVLALGLALTLSRGAWIGLALALGAWPLFKVRWSWRRRGGMCAAILLACIGLGALGVATSPQVRERFAQLVRESGEQSRPVLWRAAWALFREQPVVGTGAGSFNVAFERHRPARFLDEPQWAHNDYLNTLSDYGVMGFTLFFGAAGAIAWRTIRSARSEGGMTDDWLDSAALRGALGVGLLAFAFQLFVDFHIKIPALAMAFAVCAALATTSGDRPPAPRPATESRATRYSLLAAALGVAFAIWPMAAFFRGEALRYHARQSLDRYTVTGSGDLLALLGPVASDLRRATLLTPGNAGAWSDLSFALQLEAFASPLRSREVAGPAEETARRALKISTAVPEFWIRLGVALDMQRRFDEAQAAFDQARQLAPRSVHVWYYYAYHLSLDPQRLPAAREALATCLSLDPGNRAAEALLRRLNDRQ